MSISNTDFILLEFNQTISLDVSGAFDGSYVDIGAYDGVCNVDICLNEWAECFKIKSDSQDIDNVDASDITYYVFNSSNAGGIKGTSAMNSKPSLASQGTLKDGNPATSTVSNTPIDINATFNQLEFDFIRHISNSLFSTPYGVDLFNNETELRLSLEQVCDDGSGNLLNKLEDVLIAAAAEYSGGSTNKDSSNNLTYVLVNQLFQKQPSRFNNLYDGVADPSLPIPLPWADGDKIWYLLTVNAAPNQHLLVRENDPVASRTYLIKMTLKA